MLAYAVLDQVLDQFKIQGLFTTSGRSLLGTKMEASKGRIPWQDYALVEKGKDARNALAHEAVLVPKSECLAFIDAIERELTAWGVIAASTRP